MTVKIETASTAAAEQETVAVEAEAQAAADMAAQAQQSQEEVKPVSVENKGEANPDDNESDWAEFIEESDEAQEVVETEPEVVAEEEPIIVEEVPAKAEETPVVEEAVVAVEEEVVATEETPDVVIPPSIEEVPQETRTPEEVTAAVKEARSKAHETLTSQYTMTEEQVEEFRDNPGESLAKLAADMYLDTFDSIMSAVQQQVPQMIQQITVQNNQRQAADKVFFGAWPQLAKVEYRQTIDRIAQNYRSMNPETSNEEAVKEIGAQAWVALRLPLDQLMAHTSGKPQEVVTPPPQAAVQTPASPGNASTARRAVPVVELNEFEALAEEFIQDDLRG